jgi:hypothetical protein
MDWRIGRRTLDLKWGKKRMQIEITEKEKTALSILLGLRQKFAKEQKIGQTYSAHEMHKLFSEVIGKINKEELKYLDTIKIAHTPQKQQDPIWDVVDEAIERSKIKRYDWNKIFGKSLTQEILYLKKSGLMVDDAFEELKQDIRVSKFIDENKKEKDKILENLKISVHARFGENNTARKVMENDQDDN